MTQAIDQEAFDAVADAVFDLFDNYQFNEDAMPEDVRAGYDYIQAGPAAAVMAVKGGEDMPFEQMFEKVVGDFTANAEKVSAWVKEHGTRIENTQLVD